MFKPSPQTRSKSPYQAKLIQQLMDSDNDSIDDQFFNNQQQYSQTEQDQNSNTSRFNNTNHDNKKLTQNSFHTVKTQPTAKSNLTNASVSGQFSKFNNRQTIYQKHKQSYFADQSANNLQKKQNSKGNIADDNGKKVRSGHSPAINIKYDSIKLSDYNTDQIKKQQQMYKQNVKDFRERFYNTKVNSSKDKSQKTSNKNSINQSSSQMEYSGGNQQYIDSLDAMQRTNRTKSRNMARLPNHLQQVDPPSSRIKFLQSNKQPLQNNSQQQTPTSQYPQLQKLKQQLKQSKDIIKTLGIKNTDLQKTLQMKTTKLLQLESQSYGNSRISQNISSKLSVSIEKQVYDKLGKYLKQRVKEFMGEIQNIKMNPVLEQSLENFLAEIIQINALTVNKKLGLGNQNDIQQQAEQKNLPTVNKSFNQTPNRLSKSIFNTKSLITDNKQSQHISYPNHHQYSTTTINQNHPNYRNRFQTVNTQSHIIIQNNNNRQNVLMNNKLSNNKRQHSTSNYTTLKVDLSAVSNKQNITPNKKLGNNNNADEQFRKLQKSLQKLKTMEKQLHCSPVPTNKRANRAVTEYYYSHIDGNRQQDDMEKRSYYLTNKSGLYREQNSFQQLNTSSNLDRSKSRRKKIFADTNHK